MSRKMNAAILLFAMSVILSVVGCGDDNNSTGSNLVVGDTSSARFQAADSFLGEASLGDAMSVSSDLSAGLLNSQFPGWNGTSSPKTLPRNSSVMGDTTIVSIDSYTFLNGWHIFSFSAAVMVGVDTFAIVNGSDSVQVLAGGTAQQIPDSTSNEIRIRNHFDWTLAGDTAGFRGDHSLDVLEDSLASVPIIKINATIDQSVFEDFTVNPLTDSAAVCFLRVDFSGNINNMTFALDTMGDAENCPMRGSMKLTANMALNCAAIITPDSLDVNGTWTVNSTVLTNGEIRTQFSDGTTSWTVTEPCDPTQGLGSSPMIARR